MIAILLWLPNLVWQFMNGWPVLALGADIAEEFGGVAGRLGLLGQALAMFSPVIAIVWIYGLVQLFREPDWAKLRPIAVAFLVATVGLSDRRRKGLLPGGSDRSTCGGRLHGAGRTLVCSPTRRGWCRPGRVRCGGLAGLRTGAAGPHVRGLLLYRPRLRPARNDRLAGVRRPVRATVDSLPVDQRATAVVFTRNYGEAGALDWYGLGRPVFSGHNAFADWGPPPEGARPVIVVGLADPAANFTDCRIAAMINNDADADNEERGPAHLGLLGAA